MLITQAFRPMVELEKELAALYDSWADRFSSDREASALFAKLSRDERSHASLIEYQQRIFQKNPQFKTGVSIDVATIEAELAAVRALRAKPPASVAQAVTIAAGIETSTGDGHYRSALTEANEEVARLLNSLSREDGAHVAALREFAASRGIPLPL